MTKSLYAAEHIPIGAHILKSCIFFYIANFFLNLLFLVAVCFLFLFFCGCVRFSGLFILIIFGFLLYIERNGNSAAFLEVCVSDSSLSILWASCIHLWISPFFVCIFFLCVLLVCLFCFVLRFSSFCLSCINDEKRSTARRKISASFLFYVVVFLAYCVEMTSSRLSGGAFENSLAGVFCCNGGDISLSF